MKSLSGDGADGQKLQCGHSYTTTWDAAADYPDFNSSSFDVVVITVAGLYAVVDLSAGSNGTSYPVRYTDEAPDVSQDTCRTTELWLRYIEPGTFTMGSPKNEVGRYHDETQHQVTLTQGYYIGVFECTQRQWELVMGTRPSDFSNDAYYATRPVEKVSYNRIRGSSAGAGWPQGGHAVDENSFMGKLRARTGLNFDLPTEAQWEYACRAGTTSALNSGENLTSVYQDAAMDKVGRYCYNGGFGSSSSCGTSNGTAKVGSYMPNNWKLYDMHGNVWEWCLDRYGAYGAWAQENPVGAETGARRMVRRGCFYDGCGGYYFRSALRDNSSPDNAVHIIGFRVSLLLKQ